MVGSGESTLKASQMTGKRFLNLVLAQRCTILLIFLAAFAESVVTVHLCLECSKGSTKVESVERFFKVKGRSEKYQKKKDSLIKSRKT